MADMEVLAPGGHQHLVDKIKEQLAMKADASLASTVSSVARNQPISQISGDVLTASDAYAAPPLGASVYGKSEQDGTPTPDAPVPIESVDALTLLFGSSVTFYDSDSDWKQGTIKLDGDTTTASNRIRSVVIPVSAGASYSIRVNDGFLVGTRGYTADTATSASYVADDFHDFAQSYVWTSTTSTYLRLLVKRTNDARLTPSAAAEVGAVVSPDEIASTPIPLDGHVLRSLPNGTRDELTLTYQGPGTTAGTGLYAASLTQKVGSVDMGSLNWSFVYQGQQYEKFWAKVSDMAVMQNSAVYVMSDSYAGYRNGGAYELMPDYTIAVRPTTEYISAKDPRFDNAADFIQAVNGVIAYYPLATPITHDLGTMELPYLPAPEMTVWADPSCELQMEYIRDTQIVIESLNADIERAYSSIAPVESGVSSANYSVGDYLMLDGVMCRVTSAIATGETITVGTNVVTTTVDAELASLA